MYKSIEDGILQSLHTAQLFQLKNIKNFNFRYYDQEDVNKIIDKEIAKCIRREKLKKIENNE